jgi:hypothetical protein
MPVNVGPRGVNLWSRNQSLGAVATSLVVKATPGWLRDAEFSVSNGVGAGVALYAMIFNKTIAPVALDVPVRVSLPLVGAPTGGDAVGAYGIYDLGQEGLFLSAGIVIALSTSPLVYAAPGAHYGTFAARYL